MWQLVRVTLAILALAPAATSPIATINSASTDGMASNSVFQLSVTASTPSNALSTATELVLTLQLAPQESHRGATADIYTVIVAGGQFFTLDPDGGYSPWNGALETLTPFATAQILSTTNNYTLIDGKMTEAQQKAYLKDYEAKLISADEAAMQKRGASNAGYHYLGCAKTLALMGKAFAEANLRMLGVKSGP